MKQVIAWFAENDVAANLLMILIIVGGLVTAPRIAQEVFPEFDTEMIAVSVAYPGATPDEVEESIVRRIEDRVAGLEGAKRITATAAESNGAVTIEALENTDIQKLLSDVKNQIDAIDSFPDEAEEPIVREFVIKTHVIAVAVSGDTDELTLKRIGERVRDELAALPEITQVTLSNTRPYEISVEISESALRRHGLTFDEVSAAIRRSSLDLPAGSVKTEGGEILLRTKGQAYTGREFESLVLRTRPDGTRLTLGDVARVVDGFADTDQSARFDGRPAILVQVYRVGDQSALRVAQAVKDYVASANERLPEGVTLTPWRDRSQVLRDRLSTLRRNGLQGLCLVFIALSLFLQFRLAIWVTLGIPLSFLGTLWLMPTLDVTINVLSLFSFILVLGIVVDDAIVIGENVYRKEERGMSGLRAAVTGAQEVSIPVIFGVLTTVAVFIPMLTIPGATGKILRIFPLIVIPTLIFSLIESQMVLPAHLKHVVVNRSHDGRTGFVARWKRFQAAFGASLEWFVERVYTPILNIAMVWRYAVAATFAAIVITTASIVAGGWIRISFFPNVAANNVVATLTMPQGTRAEDTRRALGKLESAADVLATELDEGYAGPFPAIKHRLASIGSQPFTQSRTEGAAGDVAFSGAHLGEVNLQMASGDERSLDAAAIASRWRELTEAIPDAVEVAFSSSLFRPGAAIDVQFASSNMEHLTAAAERLKTALAGYDGCADIADSFRPGKEELTLRIKPAAEALGLTLSDLARQLRQGFYGEESQRVQRGREDIKVMVRYPSDERRSLADIEQMRIRTPGGGEIPFSAVASVERGRGYAAIRRSDRRRIVHVTADVDVERANANEIILDLKEAVLPQLLSDYPSLSYSLEGEQREQRETMTALFRGFGVALLAIYALMAVPLRSYIQPLLVMSAIPPGIVGAIWAHLLLGLNLSFLSMFGIIALIGVVVNDSLVLVDYVNRMLADGTPLEDAVRSAGSRRFRPILLTSVTTFVGLVPLLLERSFQAQFLVPMAVSLAFGVLFATFVSLLMVPCGYLILADLGHLVRFRVLPAFGRGDGSHHDQPTSPPMERSSR